MSESPVTRGHSVAQYPLLHGPTPMLSTKGVLSDEAVVRGAWPEPLLGTSLGGVFARRANIPPLFGCQKSVCGGGGGGGLTHWNLHRSLWFDERCTRAFLGSGAWIGGGAEGARDSIAGCCCTGCCMSSFQWAVASLCVCVCVCVIY